MAHLRSSAGDDSRYIVNSALNFLHHLSDISTKSFMISYSRDMIPSDTFSPGGTIRSAAQGNIKEDVSLLCYAAIQGLDSLIYALVGISDRADWRFQKELDKSLFLALCAGNRITANLLLSFGADPGRKYSFCGLHAAARRGFHDEIKRYIEDYGVSPDVKDEMSTTPIVYAMMLEAPHDWETIDVLLKLGARADITVDGLTYAQYAASYFSGKTYLALRLEQAANTSPTYIESRTSSYTMGRD
ncbi:hypothetical protein FBEOM_3040 [Fusarium beomiforme]|uniref:Ankyrin repeat protein n=1 Tax=Fusarium beomiforme TaxID=44412 RepID=A0A9P5AQB7_9HYPO|nr:hypothetical protein FBEOM_3040 [Fusarium beomiforme]